MSERGLRARLGALTSSFVLWAKRAVFWLERCIAPVIMAFGVIVAFALRDLQLVHVPDFLGSVVSLETTAVAIMVPVVLDVAFRVYEEYRSREVRSLLLKEQRLTGLIVSTFSNAVVAMGAYVAWSWWPSSRLFVPLAVYSIVGVGGVVISLILYLRFLRGRILTEPDWLIDELAGGALGQLKGGDAK